MTKKELNKINKFRQGIEVFFTTLSNYKGLIILLLLIINLFPTNILTASNYRTGEYIKSWKTKNRDRFSVEYTHSVEKTQVIENYIIKDKDIILSDTYFSSYGAGLPATTDYKFQVLEDKFRIYDINEKIDYLVYRTGGQGADHILSINNKRYEFLEFSNPRTGVELSIEKSNLLLYMIREGFNER